MTVVYYGEDADVGALLEKNIGIIGYGEMAKAIANNLRDSSVLVTVGGSIVQQAQAEADGFSVGPAAEIAQKSDIIILLLPDEELTATYMAAVSPNLRRGHTLIFGSAYNVAFGFIEPPPFVDVGLVSPRVDGDTVRKCFLGKEGFPSFVAVGQDASSRAWDTVLAVALVIGSLKTGAVEVTVEQEAALSLFVQQAILPAIYHIMTTAAGLLMGHGYPSEAVLTDLYLSGRFNAYMERVVQSGLLHTLRQSSKTGQYGTLSRLNRFNELKLERLMEISLEEISGGKFSQEWTKEHADGHLRLNQLLKQQETLVLWELEQQAIEFFEPEGLEDELPEQGSEDG
jgi:ketol-acid reductoisomerase